jgi:16S rRNA (uracil1498-N3)-methyltransferase
VGEFPQTQEFSRKLLDTPHPTTAVIIGPEGGFTDVERAKILAVKNVKPVSLGERILRAETAAVFAASVLIGGVW